MSAALVVGGAERGAQGTRCREQRREPAGHGAEDRPGASDEAGDLPRARSADNIGAAEGAGALSASLGACAGKKFSRADAGAHEQCGRLGEILWADLFAWAIEERTVG